MIAYIDSSVLLRLVLGQANALSEWHQIDRAVSSVLVRVEALRTLDRFRLRARISDQELARRRSAILQLLNSLELVEIDVAVLDRATHPLPTELGTLDAIHLATALLFREVSNTQLAMATHDVALGIAAQAQGFPVLGIS